MFCYVNGAAAAVATLLVTTAICSSLPHHAKADEQPRGGSADSNIGEIVVTGSPLVSDPDKLATIVGVVTREQILRSGGANLADVLSEVPGVTGTSFASGASRPVIRGFDASRVRILENGVGSFDVSDVGPDHGVPIDPLAVQKVEVVRGAATLRFGSQAIGGVVNAINNRIPLMLPEKPATVEVSGSYGTGAETRQGSALTDVRAGQFAIHADGFIRHTGDYDIPGGTLSNSFFRGNGYSLGGSYFFGDSRAGAAAVHYDAKYGIPGEDSYIDMKQTKGLFGSSFALDSGALQTLNVDGGYADYKHSEKDSAGTVLSTFLDKEWDSRAEALFGTLGPLSSAAIGVQVQHKDFSALGEGGDFLFPTTTQSVAGFAFAEAPLLPTLYLQFGARVEHVDVKGTPASDVATRRDFTPVSGSAGVVFDVSAAVKLGLTLASAARAPGQTELFARGPHDGPVTFETGDPTLRIERANSLEGTIRIKVPKVEFEGAAWGAKLNNYVYGRLTGNTCDEDGNCAVSNGEDLKELFYEQRAATFWGLEGKATINVLTTGAGTVDALVLADYVRAKFSGGGNVPRIPPYHVGGGLSWNSTAFDASFLLKYTGAQNNVSFAETPTKGYASLDAQVAWRPLPSYQNVELAVIGHNLTDRIQRNAVALNKDEVILPGRDVRFVVRAAF
jgi:iron complex outermembrane receptor protein